MRTITLEEHYATLVYMDGPGRQIKNRPKQSGLGPQGRDSHDQPTVVVCSWQHAAMTTVVECGRTRPRAHSMESEIYMRDGSSTEDANAAGLSPLRLRVGVFLILLWIVPFWILAEPIAHSLSGLSNPPSVVAITTAIVVVQTIIGLLGFWVAGTEVKSIIKGSTMRHALAVIWSMLLRGKIRGQGDVDNSPKRQPRREDA